MEPKVYEGKVIPLTAEDLRIYKLRTPEDFLAIDARAHEPKKPQMIIPIDSLVRGFLGKIVKITVEEVKV